MSLTGGALAGALTIASNSTMTIAASGNTPMNGIALTNNGTVVWQNGTIALGNGTGIYNYGLWDAQSDQNMGNVYGGNSSTFYNYGTFRKSGGASEFNNATLIGSGIIFNQAGGVLDVQNGTNGLQLALQGGGNFTGGYITTNQFGLTVLSQGGFNLNGAITGTNTWEDTGSLVGNNVINGGLMVVGGSWDQATLTVASNSTVVINAGGGTGRI